MSFTDIRVMTNTTKIRSLWADPGYGAASSFTFVPTTKAISSITQTSGLATVTTTAAHGLTIGSKPTLYVSGASPAAYTGLFVCTITTTTQFTFAIASGTASPATGTIAYATGSQTFSVPALTGYQQGWMVKLSTTGTLPITINSDDPAAQIAPGVAYIFNPPVGAPTTCNLGYDSSAITSGGAQYTAFTAGTGTHTMQAYPYLVPFGSIFTATTGGDWNYTQGAGSVATDANLVINRSRTYDVSTQVFPPYEFSNASVATTAAVNYIPNGAPPEPFIRLTETPGQTISMLPQWDVEHLYNGTASSLLNVKTASLAYTGLFPIGIRDNVTGAMVNSSATTYTGMPAAAPTFHYNAGETTTVGMTLPTPFRLLMCGADGLAWSHFEQPTAYAALVLGCPLRIDLTHDWGNATNISLASNPSAPGAVVITPSQYNLQIQAGANRAKHINGTGTVYDNVIYGSPQTRTDAWMLKHVAFAAMFTSPENQSYQQFFKDILTSNAAFATAVIAAVSSEYGSSSYPATNGKWYIRLKPLALSRCSSLAMALTTVASAWRRSMLTQ